MFNQSMMQNGNQFPKITPDQVNFVKEMLSKKGVSAETVVRQICTQRGINVDEFMQQFKDASL